MMWKTVHTGANRSPFIDAGAAERYRPHSPLAATMRLARWSNTTYSHRLAIASSSMRFLAEAKSWAASTQRNSVSRRSKMSYRGETTP